MNNTGKKDVNLGIILFIGAVAVFAVAVAWISFNRSGQNLIPTTEENIQEQTNKAQQEVIDTAEEVEDDIVYATMRAEIEARLLSIRTQLAAEEVTDETMQEISDLRGYIMQSYDRFEADVQQDLQNIDQQLESVEENAEENTAEALLTIEELLAEIRRDINNDIQMEN